MKNNVIINYPHRHGCAHIWHPIHHYCTGPIMSFIIKVENYLIYLKRIQSHEKDVVTWRRNNWNGNSVSKIIYSLLSLKFPRWYCTEHCPADINLDVWIVMQFYFKVVIEIKVMRYVIISYQNSFRYEIMKIHMLITN